MLDVARQHKVQSVEEYCSWFALKHIGAVLTAAQPSPQQIMQIMAQVQITVRLFLSDKFAAKFLKQKLAFFFWGGGGGGVKF